MIIQTDSPAEQRSIKLAGVLASPKPPPPQINPIANVLQEFHRERQQRFEKWETEAGGKRIPNRELHHGRSCPLVAFVSAVGFDLHDMVLRLLKRTPFTTP